MSTTAGLDEIMEQHEMLLSALTLEEVLQVSHINHEVIELKFSTTGAYLKRDGGDADAVGCSAETTATSSLGLVLMWLL
jgi:hypothetical protein